MPRPLDFGVLGDRFEEMERARETMFWWRDDKPSLGRVGEREKGFVSLVISSRKIDLGEASCIE